MITRSATGVTLSVSLALQVPVAELKLRAFGAGCVVQLVPGLAVPTGGVTVAVLVTLPLVAVSVAEIVYVTAPPLASVAVVLSGPVPEAAPHAVVRVPLPGALTAHVHAPIVSPLGAGSVTTAFAASFGPLLLTTTV